MNSALFRIGMFPWLCLTQLPLFFERDWPRLNNKHHRHTDAKVATTKCRTMSKQKRTAVIAGVGVYCAIQAFLPYSHFLTPGYNTWTDGPYGYSWDMMVHAWDTVLVTTKIRDNEAGTLHYLDTRKYTASNRWSKHADMTFQLAQCLSKHALEDDRLRRSLTSNNLSVYFDVWCSLNGRFQQRIFDPTVDVVRAGWQPWRRTSWILPLLNDLIEYRSEIRDSYVTDNSEVLYVADFPGMSAQHFVSAELNNVSLTVLQGTIEHSRIINGRIRETSQMRSGETASLAVGEYHLVNITSHHPAAYKYSFRNSTTESVQESAGLQSHWTSEIIYWIQLRAHNYFKMLLNIGSCLLQIN